MRLECVQTKNLLSRGRGSCTTIDPHHPLGTPRPSLRGGCPVSTMGHDPIDQLVREHRFVEGILDRAEAALSPTTAAPTPQALAAVRHHIGQLWVEFYHHSLHREEHLLFPLLGSLAPPGEGPVAVMEQEHRQMSAHFATVLTPSANAAQAGRAAAELCQVLRLHIHKEDSILFPMAQLTLSRGQLSSLAEQFARYDGALPTPPTPAAWHLADSRVQQ